MGGGSRQKWGKSESIYSVEMNGKEGLVKTRVIGREVWERESEREHKKGE